MKNLALLVLIILTRLAGAQAVYLSDNRPLIGYGWILTREQVVYLMDHPEQSPRQPAITNEFLQEDLYLVLKIRKNDVKYVKGTCIIYLNESKESLASVPFYQDRRWSGFYIRTIPSELIACDVSEPLRFRFKFKVSERIY